MKQQGATYPKQLYPEITNINWNCIQGLDNHP